MNEFDEEKRKRYWEKNEPLARKVLGNLLYITKLVGKHTVGTMLRLIAEAKVSFE